MPRLGWFTGVKQLRKTLSGLLPDFKTAGSGRDDMGSSRANSYAPAPAASAAQQGKTNAGTNSELDKLGGKVTHFAIAEELNGVSFSWMELVSEKDYRARMRCLDRVLDMFDFRSGSEFVSG